MALSEIKKIQHLNWRAGFGLAPEEYREKKNQSLEKAVDELFRGAENPAPLADIQLPFKTRVEIQALSEEEKEELQKMARNTNSGLTIEWQQRMGNPRYSAFLEKMTLFWHGHFACESKLPHFNVRQQNTLRTHALGNFGDLLLAIAKDPAMIQYLNNQQNRKEKPNENFARELMELFTIGIGNYSEKDVKEAARAFTGWTSNLKGEFIFRPGWHDYGNKTFMGESGNFNGDDIIDILLRKEETAAFISRKIYRFFVNENVNEKHLAELTELFYNSNYNIGKTMRYLFLSDWFYQPENVGTKIKSPVELIGGMIRTLGLEFDDPRAIMFVQKALGQVLLHPPNVAGWPGGKAWIDNSTLMVRLNLAGWLFKDAEVNFQIKEDAEERQFNLRNRRIKASLDVEPLIEMFSAYPEKEIYDRLTDYLLLSPPRSDESTISRFATKENKGAFTTSLLYLIMTMPEYQMC